MKTIKIYTIGLFVAAGALLSGCSNEMDETIGQESELRITALSVATDEMQTRAADANGYEGMIKTTWTANDEIALTIGNFSGKARYYYVDENHKGWEMLNADGTPVIGGIMFTKHQMNEGIDIRASYAKSGVDAVYNDELLAEETDRTRVGQVNFKPRNDNPAAFTLALGLIHTKSYIAVNLSNTIAGEEVQDVQVVLRDATGTALATPVTLQANSEKSIFEGFAQAAYIEKFVVTMQKSDNTTYEIPVFPLYGANGKGFAIQANNRYPFNITLNPSDKTKAHGTPCTIIYTGNPLAAE